MLYIHAMLMLSGHMKKSEVNQVHLISCVDDL